MGQKVRSADDGRAVCQTCQDTGCGTPKKRVEKKRGSPFSRDERNTTVGICCCMSENTTGVWREKYDRNVPMLSFTATLVEPIVPLNTSPLRYKRRVKKSQFMWIISKIRREAHGGKNSGVCDVTFFFLSCTSSFGTLPRSNRNRVQPELTPTSVPSLVAPLP